MTTLRVGVIGLGRRWHQRYLPVLVALRDRFEIRALCDQVYQRAALEARQLGCDAVTGPTALLESEEIDAVLMLDPQWFGSWPIASAARLDKPVFCSLPTVVDDPQVEAVREVVHRSRLPVMVEMLPRFAPATVFLQDLLANRLGPAQLLLCEHVAPRRGGRKESRAGLDQRLLDWCFSVLDGEPASVATASASAVGFAGLFLKCRDGRAVQVLRREGGFGKSVWRLQVEAERGSAQLELPGRISWADADGEHTHVLHGPPLVQVVLEHFHAAIQEGRPPCPSLEDACRVLPWLHAAALSAAEGRGVDLAV